MPTIHQFHPLITCEVLAASGYRRYAADEPGAAAVTFCRTVQRRTGPPWYVVAFFGWDLSFLGRDGSAQGDRHLSTEATMRLLDGHRFCVDYTLDDRTTLPMVEAFYLDVYRRLGCLPDPDAMLCVR